ncbi:MAG TPA: energy transducer TonB [Mucilaginibacter sp.]
MKTLLLILFLTVFATCLHAQKADTTNYNNNDKIFATAQIMPEYKGGMDRLYQRLENIRYLFVERMKNIEGRVLVSLVIEKDGRVSNVKILHGLTQEQDKEVVRVVKNLRRWKPGMQDGKPVRVRFILPIEFKMIKV